MIAASLGKRGFLCDKWLQSCGQYSNSAALQVRDPLQREPRICIKVLRSTYQRHVFAIRRFLKNSAGPTVMNYERMHACVYVCFLSKARRRGANAEVTILVSILGARESLRRCESVIRARDLRRINHRPGAAALPSLERISRCFHRASTSWETRARRGKVREIFCFPLTGAGSSWDSAGAGCSVEKCWGTLGN